MTEPAAPTTERTEATLGQQAASGVLWLTLQKWVVRITGFVTIAVLTRFLSPADFGTVAAASAVLPFFVLLTDLGFAAYIVQASRADRRLLSTGFWFSMVAGVVLAGALAAVAPVFGVVFRSDELVPVLQVLAIGIVLASVSSVPLALLRRTMRFRAIAGQATAAAFVAQLFAVAMTLAGLGVWALVAQVLVAQFVTAVLAWVAAAWRPAFAFSRRDFATMARFGGNVVGVEFVAMCRTAAEAAIISGTLGMVGLGYWNIAQRLVQIVQDLTGAALVPVSTVAFARLREDADRLRSAYIRALRLTYATLTPPMMLVVVAAPLIIPIVFGDQWAASERVAQVLALAGIMVVGATLDQGLCYGLGRPGRWFGYALVVDALTLAATAITVSWGIVAVAWGFLAVAVTATVSRWFLASPLLDARIRRLAAPFGFMVVSVVVSGGAGWLVLLATPGLPALLRIALVGTAILVAHLFVVRFLARGVLTDAGGYLGRIVNGNAVAARTLARLGAVPRGLARRLRWERS